MHLRLLAADDWRAGRDIRLRALQADPGAFGSTFDREAGFDEAMWRRRFTTGPDGRPCATFLVEDDAGLALGTAGVVYTEHHVAPMLVRMWVGPEARGLGAGRALVGAAVEWAVARGEREMVLWVVDDNVAAIELYRSCGFEPTGKVDALPSNPCAGELEMLAAIT